MKIRLDIFCPKCKQFGTSSGLLWGLTGQPICTRCTSRMRYQLRENILVHSSKRPERGTDDT
jgi:hypothetical protein